MSNDQIFTLESTRLAQKWENQKTVIYAVIWALGLITCLVLTYAAYNYHGHKMAKYQTELSEYQETSDVYRMHSLYWSRYNEPTKPNLFVDTWIILSLIGALVFAIFLLVLGYEYWALLCDAEDFIEFNGETGEIRRVGYYPLNRSNEMLRVIDTITGIDVYQDLYQNELNVGRLTIYASYVVAGEVYNVERELTYCEDITGSVEKIKTFMRLRGIDAVKVNIINQ